MAKYIMALDAGTTSNRCILFNEQGNVFRRSEGIYPVFPPARVGGARRQRDLSTQIEVARRAMANIGATAADIAAIGITNQRETTILWDRRTGRPIHNAIVWQCRRTATSWTAFWPTAGGPH